MLKKIFQNIKNKISENKWVAIFLQFSGLVVLTALLRNPFFIFRRSVFFAFQERDLARAKELISGHPIFYGPEVTGGGFLPGPFYYLLLSPPLALGLNWMGTWVWMYFLISVGGALGWFFFKNKFNSMTAFLWLILYSSAMTTTQLIAAFLNPSFTIGFLVLINILILKAFTEDSQRTRNIAFVSACFISGLIIQLHYSGLVFIFALIFLMTFSRRLKILSVQLNYFMLGLGAFFLTLVPYFTMRLFQFFGIQLGQETWRGGSAVNSLPSLFKHFKISSDIPAAIFFNLSARKFFLLVPIVLITLLLVLWILKSKSKQKEPRAVVDSMITIATICTVFSFIPYSFYFFVPQGGRYGAPFSATLGFLVILIFQKVVASKQGVKYFNILGFLTLILVLTQIFLTNPGESEEEFVIYLLSVFLLLALVLFYRFKKNPEKNELILAFVLTASLFIGHSVNQNQTRKLLHWTANNPNYWQWQRISSTIYAETGWSFQEFAKRVYFVNHHIEQAPKWAYLTFSYSNPRYLMAEKIKPDGYIVSIGDWNINKNLDWILKQEIHQDIRTGLLSGDIVLGKFEVESTILIAPYYIKNRNLYPNSFSNLGLGYEHLPEEKLLRSIEFSTGVKKVDQQNFIFKWNECPDKHYFCDTAVLVKAAQKNTNTYEVDLKIVGMSLSQVSKWIIPGWTQGWIEPYVEMRCNNKTSRTKIAGSIGYLKTYLNIDPVFKYNVTNNSLLAPLERHLIIKCEGELEEISIGRVSTQVEQDNDSLTMPETKLTLKL